MLNFKNNNQKFWVITMIFALMLILIFEQRRNNNALNIIKNTLICIKFTNHKLLNFFFYASR